MPPFPQIYTYKNKDQITLDIFRLSHHLIKIISGKRPLNSQSKILAITTLRTASAKNAIVADIYAKCTS